MVTHTHTIYSIKDADALTEILAVGAAFPLIVTGSSMFPFLKENRDTVVLQKTDRMKQGQIVFFRRKSGEFILHRIRKIYPNGLLLINGDAQAWCEVIHREQVLAIVKSIKRDKRYIDPDSFLSVILRCLWFPTRPIRPSILRVYSFLAKFSTA